MLENKKMKQLCVKCLPLIAFFATVIPASADAFSDVIEGSAGAVYNVLQTALIFIIRGIASLLASLLYGICFVFIKALEDIDTDTVLNVFDSMTTNTGVTFSSGIIDIGIFIIGMIAAIEIVKTILSGLTGEKMTTSPITIAIRAFMAVVMTMAFALPVSKAIWKIFATIHQDFLRAADDLLSITDPWGGYSLASTGVLSQVGFNEITADLLGVVIAAIMVVVTYYNVFQLILELAQRYGVSLMYVFLSPLATACYTSPSTASITTKWFQSLFTQCVLMSLNGWVAAFAVTACAMPGKYGGQTSATFLAYALVAYALVKAAQQIDDVFNNVGASVVRQQGGLLKDLAGMMSSVRAVKNTVAGYRGMKSTLRDDIHSGGTIAGARAQSGAGGIGGAGLTAATNSGNVVNPATGTVAARAAATNSGTNASIGKAQTLEQQLGSKASEMAQHTLLGSALVGATSRVTRADNALSEHKLAKENACKVQTASDLSGKASTLAEAKKSAATAPNNLALQEANLDNAVKAKSEMDKNCANYEKAMNGGREESLKAATDNLATRQSEMAAANESGDSNRIAAAQSNLADAKEKMQYAKTAYDKTAPYEGADGDGVKTVAQHDCETAAKNVETAEGDVVTARQKIDSANESVTKAQESVDRGIENCARQHVFDNDTVKDAVAESAGLSSGAAITAISVNKDGTMSVGFDEQNQGTERIGQINDFAMGAKAENTRTANIEQLNSNGTSYGVTLGSGEDYRIDRANGTDSNGKPNYKVVDTQTGDSFVASADDAKTLAYAMSGMGPNPKPFKSDDGSAAPAGYVPPQSSCGAVSIDTRQLGEVNGASIHQKTGNSGAPQSSPIETAYKNVAQYTNGARNTKERKMQSGRKK